MTENTDLHPVASDAASAAPVVLPSRIAPPEVADGAAPIELMPPCSGSWRRDADGGLTPLDAPTAAAAGLSFAG